MKGMTQRQLQVLSFIQEFIQKHRYSPSYREIKDHFGFASLGTVYKHVDTLKKKGKLSHEKKSSRSMALLAPQQERSCAGGLMLPFIGHISAERSIEMFSQSQSIIVPEFLVINPSATYVLRVQGKSLEEEMIGDGDLLLIEAGADVDDGDTLLGSTPQHPLLVKQYHPEGQYVRLKSRSPRAEPLIIRYDDLEIKGKMIGLIRLFA